MIHLSQVIGQPVSDPNGESMGTVADLIVAVGERYPPVTGLVIATDRRQIFLPWTSVAAVDETGARLQTQTIDIGKFKQRPNEILLRADLMDKQIVDIDGRKVVRVNDLSLDDVEGSLRLVGEVGDEIRGIVRAHLLEDVGRPLRFEVLEHLDLGVGLHLLHGVGDGLVVEGGEDARPVARGELVDDRGEVGRM